MLQVGKKYLLLSSSAENRIKSNDVVKKTKQWIHFLIYWETFLVAKEIGVFKKAKDPLLSYAAVQL